MSENTLHGKQPAEQEPSQLYHPSWVDHFTDWAAKMPGRPWYYFLGIGLGLVLIQNSILWVEGTFPVGIFLPTQVFLAGAIAFLLSLFYYLDEWASAALQDLYPSLNISNEELANFNYRITTMPAGRTILAGIAALIFVFISERITTPYYTLDFGFSNISIYFSRFIYLLCWWIFGSFIYHTIRQLGLINKIYSCCTNIHIFRMKPFYAFSNLSAFTAGSLTVLPYGFLLVNPGEWQSDMVTITIILAITLLAVVTFLWPQVGMHRLQEAEQERLMDQAYLRLEASIRELHQRLDKKDYREMEDLNFAINSLEIELNALKGIRTWPWEPETLQILLTALALPLGLWLLQFIVERVFGA